MFNLQGVSPTEEAGEAARENFSCPLPNDFARVLVFPDPEKDRLTETVIPGPFREFDLADHFRLHPMTALHFGGG